MIGPPLFRRHPWVSGESGESHLGQRLHGIFHAHRDLFECPVATNSQNLLGVSPSAELKEHVSNGQGPDLVSVDLE
jgi:hypothetical protein